MVRQIPRKCSVKFLVKDAALLQQTLEVCRGKDATKGA
jgi:hypothetical protein